ncbi:hypothetical protein Pmani_029421 [Petrolisthes manimaculis]|uniref:Uncharacterized protein n=1 Tax=Petrolisthes manimaculis TaxID=1843537 RepID=A0AAE1NYS2_9EUCA|nr:hypothetical protein Pmani_029421 [Petrolisthes manimaculis]
MAEAEEDDDDDDDNDHDFNKDGGWCWVARVDIHFPPDDARDSEWSTGCPEDLCKQTLLTEGPGGVLAAAPPVKVVCHDHLRITSLTDVFPHCLPTNTRVLDLSSSGITRIPSGILSHLPGLDKL